MIPGEYRLRQEKININHGRKTETVEVVNRGDRPIQVGSHFHFFEVNKALDFDRIKSYGMRLNIPAGTAVRFEPGEEKPVELVELGGTKTVWGFSALTSGKIDKAKQPDELQKIIAKWKESESDG